MATQGTDNLVIVDNMPAVEKLWNGRYRLEFFCKIQNPNEGWYSDSIDKWLPSFGALQDADFAGEGWSARDGEAYPDMRLVKCEAKYIAPSETHLVTLTYETLTASWVAEKDEDIDYELNGLQRVSRTFVALPETSYAKVVGTDTITVGGDVLTLGAFKIEKTDSMWSLTETWLESGQVSTSTDLVGSQQAQVIESFGEIPATPSGYVLANEQESDIGGIPTRRYTFLKPSTLSESTDNVGSQLAKVIEAFSEIPATPSGYVLAKTDVSDFDGIPTRRYTFLKPSILSVSQQFIGGSATVQVQAFNKTSAEVDTALSEVTASHVLISEGESDYEGIKTSSYQYQLDESFTEDCELNGLKRISLIELSSADFTAQTVGDISVTAPTAGLYLGTQEIDNGGTVKLRESVWLEAGTISISRSSESDGVMSVTTVFFGVEGSTVGPVIAKKTDNFEGMPTISVTTLQDANGNSIVSGGENLVNQVSGLSPFSYPGVLDVSIAQDTFDGGDRLKVKALLIDAPAQCKVKTTTYFIFQTSNSIAASDYSYAGSDGLWSPNHWAAFSINAVGTFSDGLFNDSSTFRGYRSSSSSQSGTLDGPLLSYANLIWQGRAVLIDEEEITYAITVDQGPPNPTGNTYTLDVQITPAFDDVDGNQYYKKTIVVTDTIPTQPDTASLPYT